MADDKTYGDKPVMKKEMKAGKGTMVKKGRGMGMALMPGDMKYADVPGFAGVHMAVVEGKPEKGPSHFVVKFDKGFTAPMHHHTADHHVHVLSGTVILTVDGKDVRLPAGSFFTFSGMKSHATRCEAAMDCELAIDARGAWDVIPEETTAMAGDKPMKPGMKAKAKPMKGKGMAKFVMASDLKWTDIPDMPGVTMAVVEGDPAKGPSHFIARLTQGKSLPVHHHTADHYGHVTAGTMIFTVDGKDLRLPAGSFYALTGKIPHQTRCEAGADCELTVDARAKWDMIPETTAMLERKR